MALDPRTLARRKREREARESAELHSNTPDRAWYGTPHDATSGAECNSALPATRHPKRNTMSNARNGGTRVSYFDPAEHADQASLRPSVLSSPPLSAHTRKLTADPGKARAESDTEGLRLKVRERQNAVDNHELEFDASESNQMWPDKWPFSSRRELSRKRRTRKRKPLPPMPEPYTSPYA